MNMKLDERHDVIAMVARDGIRMTLDGTGVEGSLVIGVRRTVIADDVPGLLPDMGALEVRPTHTEGRDGAEFEVPVWRADAVWLDLTADVADEVSLWVSRDGGPETRYRTGQTPWIERCRGLDGRTRQMTAPADSTSRVDIRVGGSATGGGSVVALHLIDALRLADTKRALPRHDPLDPIDYAQNNIPWPFADAV